MTNGGPEKILKGLREHSDDENVGKFLVDIFNEEFRGIRIWKKTYIKTLKKYSK